MSKEKLKTAASAKTTFPQPSPTKGPDQSGFHRTKGGSVLSGHDKTTLAFGKNNYKMMVLGIALVALGMILMIGGASEDPNVFSTDIFNFQRLTLAPILIVAGYVVVLLAILKKPKE